MVNLHREGSAHAAFTAGLLEKCVRVKCDVNSVQCSLGCVEVKIISFHSEVNAVM